METISAGMRDVLIEHLDGRQVKIVNAKDYMGLEARGMQDRQITVAALLRRHWIRATFKHTVITEKGRAALARCLGEYADALSRAAATGYYAPPRPVYERTMEEARLDQQ